MPSASELTAWHHIQFSINALVTRLPMPSATFFTKTPAYHLTNPVCATSRALPRANFIAPLIRSRSRRFTPTSTSLRRPKSVCGNISIIVISFLNASWPDAVWLLASSFSARRCGNDCHESPFFSVDGTLQPRSSFARSQNCWRSRPELANHLMTFGAPEWFWAFAIFPILVSLYLRAERRRMIILREFISPRLLPKLAGNVDRTRRAIRFICVLLSVACAITALAKPRWGYAYEDVKRRGLDLLLAVDTSRSMLSNDVPPNRLARVKLATQDLINDLTGDRVGLIAFAGRAFLQGPLTIDYDAAVESINDIDTKTIPEGGMKISEAIGLAVQTFGKTATGNRALIIFTDGEELSGNAVKEAKNAADAGIRIFNIGVGTAQGSLIPIESENGSAFVKDSKGQVVKSRLDENRLRQIAQATGGSYFHLENGPQTMRQLYEQGLAKLQAGEIDARLSRRPIERYEWPLAAAILTLAASIFINDRKRTRLRAVVRRLATAALVCMASNVLAAAPAIVEYRQQKYNEPLQQVQTTLTKHLQNP